MALPKGLSSSHLNLDSHDNKTHQSYCGERLVGKLRIKFFYDDKIMKEV